MGYVFSILLMTLSLGQISAQDLSIDRRLPDDVESHGGHSLGFAQGGMAALDGQEGVRMNPAMLAYRKMYEVGAGYNWTTFGREFFQASIVDSISSNDFIAGVAYTGFIEKFDAAKLDDRRDSLVERRAHLALAKTLQRLAIGAGAQYVEAYDPETFEKKKGTALQLGVSSLLTPQLRLAVAARNMGNASIADYAPRSYQIGAAYLLAKGDISLNFDLKQRDRVSGETMDLDPEMSLTETAMQNFEEENNRYSDQEKLAIASGSARIYDSLRLFGGYAKEVSKAQREIIAGGLATVSPKNSFSFAVSKPYADSEKTQQAFNLSFMMTF
jgi:hypothetical protein